MGAYWLRLAEVAGPEIAALYPCISVRYMEKFAYIRINVFVDLTLLACEKENILKISINPELKQVTMIFHKVTID